MNNSCVRRKRQPRRFSMVCFVFFLWHASLRMLWICSFHFTRGKRFSFTASLHVFRFDYRFHVSCLSTSLLGVCPLLVVGALRLAFLRQIHFPQTANCSLFFRGASDGYYYRCIRCPTLFFFSVFFRFSFDTLLSP